MPPVVVCVSRSSLFKEYVPNEAIVSAAGRILFGCCVCGTLFNAVCIVLFKIKDFNATFSSVDEYVSYSKRSLYLEKNSLRFIVFDTCT